MLWQRTVTDGRGHRVNLPAGSFIETHFQPVRDRYREEMPRLCPVCRKWHPAERFLGTNPLQKHLDSVAVLCFGCLKPLSEFRFGGLRSSVTAVEWLDSVYLEQISAMIHHIERECRRQPA